MCKCLCVPGTRARDRPVRDVTEGPGMDRTISEQLNKAFEAYRNASIEKELARKELQHKVPFVNDRLAPSEALCMNGSAVSERGQTLTYCSCRPSSISGTLSSWRDR